MSRSIAMRSRAAVVRSCSALDTVATRRLPKGGLMDKSRVNARLRNVRGGLRLAAAGLLMAIALVVAAGRVNAQCTTQASGALVMSPNHGQNCTPGGPPPGPDALVSGEAVTTTVSIVNTSTRST